MREVKMGILETINKYTESIVDGDYHPPATNCIHCHKKPEKYKLQDRRKRKLRFVAKDVVKVVITLLLRWKCPKCGATFTQYPPFILPHKRFVLTDIVQFGEQFLTSEDSSYEDVAKTDGTNICYLDENGLCESFFSPSSVWRFLEYLASIYESNRELFRKKHEKTQPVLSSKYRSNRRKNVLYRALKAVMAMRRSVGLNFSPSFETERR